MKKGARIVLTSILSTVLFIMSACSVQPTVTPDGSASIMPSETTTSNTTATNGATVTTDITATATVTATPTATPTPGTTSSTQVTPTQVVTPEITSTPTATPTVKPTATSSAPAQSQKAHIIMMSDIHLCHLSWNGHTSEYRMDKMIKDLNQYNKENPYSNILFMGDYSLDFWQHGEGGSYVNKGISNTKNLIDDYLVNLDCKDYVLIPGNHEQYSNEKWKEITGNDRQTSVVINGWLFILLDNFNANLDPNYNSDGTYTQADVNYIKAQMDKYPDMPVILAAHYFNKNSESAEFKELVANEDRIVCLFSGHEHKNTNERLSDSWGKKYMFNFGNYSYTKNVNVKRCMWGWRSLEFDKDGITVEYYSPQSTIIVDGAEYTNTAGVVSSVYLANPVKK